MLANVQQTTIRPIIEGVVAPGSCIHTDEYSIYARLTAWGYRQVVARTCPMARATGLAYEIRPDLTLDAHLALQSEPRPSPSHPQAEA